MRSLVITGLLCAAAVSPAGAVSLINLNFTGSMTGTRRQTFVDAEAFWNSTITGYTLNSYHRYSQPHSLTIDVSLPAIDGAYGTLGSAGPKTANYFNAITGGTETQGLFYTATGAMRFDSADVDMMIASSTFFLSTVTLGGLADPGYTADYSKAGVINYSPSAVPEPASVLAMAALLDGGLLTRRRSLAC